jgi:hypothetical protein
MLGLLAALRWLRYAMTFRSPVLPEWGEIVKEGFFAFGTQPNFFC